MNSHARSAKPHVRDRVLIGHAPQRVRARSRRAPEPEVGTARPRNPLFVVHNSLMTNAELRDANFA